MPRYLFGLALASVLAIDQFALMQAFAGDGEVIVTRQVPYQSATGPIHTGRVLAVDVSPDSQVVSVVNATSFRGAGALSELTDLESSGVASRVGSNNAGLTSGLKTTAALQGLASGKHIGAAGGAFAPTGLLGSMTSTIGSGVGGSVGRATDALSNTLSGAAFGAGGLK